MEQPGFRRRAEQRQRGRRGDETCGGQAEYARLALRPDSDIAAGAPSGAE
jgi:hypothetical protein